MLNIEKIVLALSILSFGSVCGQSSNIKITNANYKHYHAKWSPVEDLLLFDSDMEGKKSIYITNSKGENVRRLTSLAYEDWLPAWSPDGKKVAYSSIRDGKNKIFVYDLITNKEMQLTTEDDWGPSWSPDGKQIAYSSKLEEGRNVREIFVIDVDGKNSKRLTHNKKSNIIPVFSADGKRIFYQSNAGSNDSGKPDIYSYHLFTSKN